MSTLAEKIEHHHESLEKLQTDIQSHLGVRATKTEVIKAQVAIAKSNLLIAKALDRIASKMR